MQAALKETGIYAKLVIASDAAAALAAAGKLSGGRVRHLQAYETFAKQLLKRRFITFRVFYLLEVENEGSRKQG